MRYKNTSNRYGSLPIGLHWVMFLFLVAVYVAINLHGYQPKGSALRAAMLNWHFGLGLCVLVLIVVRIGARFSSGPAPLIAPPIPRWQKLLAGIMHFALYAFMLGMPVLGWVAISAKGSPVHFFGWQLPMLIGPDKALYKSLKEVHETIGTIGYYLIGLHVAAALGHHYVMRDNTLLRMLPGR